MRPYSKPGPIRPFLNVGRRTYWTQCCSRPVDFTPQPEIKRRSKKKENPSSGKPTVWVVQPFCPVSRRRGLWHVEDSLLLGAPKALVACQNRLLPTFTHPPPPAAAVMEEGAVKAEGKVYAHYNHTDSCKLSRWTARESFQFMHTRPWLEVNDFYSNLVKGGSSLMDLFGAQHLQKLFVRDAAAISPEDASDATELEGVPSEDRSGRWARATFKIVLSYHGASFDGWQKQPGLNTVQGLVERSLGGFADDKKVNTLKEKCKPLEVCAVVAGRTDKGVSAIQQVCSFYTWRKDVKPHEIEDAINKAEPGKVRVVSVSKVSRVFHPNFSAKWRRYMYIFPFNDGENGNAFESEEDSENNIFDTKSTEQRDANGELISENTIKGGEDEPEGAKKPRRFNVCRVNQLLQQLEGKLLSYKMFARDTKAARNEGPPTECFIYHARAAETRLPSSDPSRGRKVMCVELVANRFLRKMVRVLVATSIREAAAGAEEDVLLKLMDATCRRATAPPAPPDGLCLVDVGYSEFDSQNCIIP